MKPSQSLSQAAPVYERIEQLLKDRAANNLLRTPTIFERVTSTHAVEGDKTYVNFSSNDYLGLAADFDVSTLPSDGVLSGSTASPLVVGEHDCHQQLKDTLLSVLNADSSYECVLFSSGYAANQAFISAFVSAFSTTNIYQDKLNHASLIEAGRHAKQANKHVSHRRFRHNDIEHLRNLVTEHSRKQRETDDVALGAQTNLIISEGVFSMDGDMAPMRALIDLKHACGALIYIDDAHGFGCFESHQTNDQTSSARQAGLVGTSLSNADLCINDVDAYLVAFGKALGSQGAALILKKPLANLIHNFGKEYIYSTALSPLQVHATLSNLHRLINENERTISLKNNVSLFKRYFESVYNGNVISGDDSALALMRSDSAVQPILVGNEKRAVWLSQQLKERGFLVSAMRPPTVQKGTSRLRVTINCKHSVSDIKALVDCIVELERQSNKCDVASFKTQNNQEESEYSDE